MSFPLHRDSPSLPTLKLKLKQPAPPPPSEDSAAVALDRAEHEAAAAMAQMMGGGGSSSAPRIILKHPSLHPSLSHASLSHASSSHASSSHQASSQHTPHASNHTPHAHQHQHTQHTHAPIGPGAPPPPTTTTTTTTTNAADKKRHDPAAPSSSSHTNKKKKSSSHHKHHTLDSAASQELKILLGRLTMAVRQYTNAEGRNLAALFLALPSKQLYPDYYILIKHPTALNIMQQKINAGKYHSISDLRQEMQLMVENAKTYNSPESLIYEDALTLWEVFNAEVAKVKAQHKKQSLSSTASSSSSSSMMEIDILGGGGGGPTSGFPSASAAPLKLKLKPEPAEVEMVMNKDGKRIAKKEIDLLFRAIEDNNVKAFERAIHQLKIDPNILHKTKIDGLELEWGPLHAVSYYGRAKMLDILVGQKASLELRDSVHGSTPLMWAAYAGKVNTAKRLMRNNRPDKFAKNNRGMTAMDLAADPENPEWRGILNNETPVLTLDKTGMPLDGSRRDRDRERRVSKLPVPEADSPGQSFQKITYVGDMSLPDAHSTRGGSNPRSQVKDTTPMVRPTMPVDLNKVPKWAKLPNTKDANQLFLAAGSKELAILLEAPPIKDIEVPLPSEGLTHLLHPGLKTPRANAITVSRTIHRLPIRFYLANGNKGVFYSIQVYQNRTPLLPTLLNGGTEDSDDREPTVVEVLATLWEGVNVFDVI
ncbi:hypothetical protein HDU98_002821, partial [Podochytrium sp. JEL0797]